MPDKLSVRLNCPLPELDFDMITLGHGSGGLLTNRLLDNSIFELFQNEMLDQRHDGAILDIQGPLAFTTDSFVISPILFPGGNIGELAVNGTVNDIAMCGAVPAYMSLALILEEGLKMDDLWEVLLGVKSAAEKAGIMIVTGDTKVVERGKGDKIFINTTGVGKVHPGASIDMGRIHPGDHILLSGDMATHGISIMSVREGLEFESDIVSDTQPLNSVVIKLLDELGKDIALLRDPTRGGVATVLNEIAVQSSLGIDISEEKLPVDPMVRSACEILGLDPMYVANEGIFIAVVRNEVVDKALDILHHTTEGKNASDIGIFTSDHEKKVIIKSTIGGLRVVNMLPGDQLPRIC
jgi:hydrogenase expression/formation protein HypE